MNDNNNIQRISNDNLEIINEGEYEQPRVNIISAEEFAVPALFAVAAVGAAASAIGAHIANKIMGK